MNRVAFYFGYAWIEAVPFVKEPIEALAEQGIEVDLYMPINNVFPKPSFESTKITIIPFWFSGRSPWRIAAELLMASLRRRYCLIFANPNNPVVFGMIIGKLTRCKLVIFSDEIEPEKSRLKFILLKAGYLYSELIVITDLLRLPVLKTDFSIASDKVFELPNCPKRDGKAIKRKIEAEKNIQVLYLGTLIASFGAEIIIKAIPLLERTMLTVKEMSARTPEIRVMASIIESCLPVKFIFDSISYHELNDFVNKYDIGIVLYTNDSDTNIRTCGKGSGKLCRFLMLGKPVIISGGSLEWVASYGAGICVSSAEELIKAIEIISHRYEMYSTAARKCYEEHFSFQKYYPPIENRLLGLVRSS